MKRIILLIMLIVFAFVNSVPMCMDALDIVKKGDAVVNAPEDAYILATMTLVDKNGIKNERKSEMYQKGAEKRLVRFLSPADQKGIGFLTLPNDVMYLYLPAFHKIRQIASHVKSQTFAGTDLTYEELSEFELAKDNNPELVREESDSYVIKLIPEVKKGKDYIYLLIWYRKDNFYPVIIEYYDNNGKIYKTIERKDLKKIKGYWISMKMEVKDLKKSHSTINIMDKVDFDLGLDDDVFTKRNLIRVR